MRLAHGISARRIPLALQAYTQRDSATHDGPEYPLNIPDGGDAAAEGVYHHLR